jgi:hypothetical protein
MHISNNLGREKKTNMSSKFITSFENNAKNFATSTMGAIKHSTKFILARRSLCA